MNSGWFAMSARYSNTSSRGRSIVMLSSTGSTAPGVLPDAARTDPDGPLVLRRAHELAALRGSPAARPAQLADDRLRVEVDPLADQRRAVAVRATGPFVGEEPDALAQQRLRDRCRRGGGKHGFESFAAGQQSPSEPAIRSRPH